VSALAFTGALRRRGWRGSVDLARAAVLITVVEVGLRTLRLPQLCALLRVRFDLAVAGVRTENLDERGAVLVPSRSEAAGLRAVRTVLTRGPVPSTCLRRALTAGWVLRRHDPELRVGVSKNAGEVTAHAWLIVAGANLDPSGAAQFTELTPLTES
jgi:hypothetical protein